MTMVMIAPYVRSVSIIWVVRIISVSWYYMYSNRRPVYGITNRTHS